MAKLTAAQQQDFLRSYPNIEPAAGAWGRGGATVIDLARADEETVRQALTTAWSNIAGGGSNP
jgi:hypothetical protein